MFVTKYRGLSAVQHTFVAVSVTLGYHERWELGGRVLNERTICGGVFDRGVSCEGSRSEAVRLGVAVVQSTEL